MGGMARAARVVARMPQAILTGSRVRIVVDELLRERPELIGLCVEAIGADYEGAGPPDSAVELLRSKLSKLFGGVDTGP
eukprot:13894203-Heterocapsa_arctica.AAC.1